MRVTYDNTAVGGNGGTLIFDPNQDLMLKSSIGKTSSRRWVLTRERQ